ncbi:MAG: deoxyguanosinetriphosphate triphosphohydrolase [Candidatus Omnitrophota bacterium]
MLTRKEIEKREDQWLAPYAMKSALTGGRQYEEKEHPYRTVYQRDKDRVIYSTAFRRLEYKTQVFVNHEGDYYRTRLTHTIEVAQIARTIARALKLNEELVEAIALAHDLGHTPFGHAGENTLSELMKENGGFDHNTHGLRVVDVLEKRHPGYDGLNLTREVRRGIIRHSSPHDRKRDGHIEIPGLWLLEIQVVDFADEIAYDNHDLDDGLKSGLLNENDLEGLAVWDKASFLVTKQFPGVEGDVKRSQIIRCLIDQQVSDIVKNTIEEIKKRKIKNTADLENQKERVVCFSKALNAERVEAREVLMKKLYGHYRVRCMTNKAGRFLKKLFQVYCDCPDLLPPGAADKIKERGKFRVICDYIAGMTDRYALDQYKKFFEPYERV